MSSRGKRILYLVIALMVAVSCVVGAKYGIRLISQHMGEQYARLDQANLVCQAISEHINQTGSWPKNWGDIRGHLNVTDSEAAAVEKEIGVDFTVTLEQVVASASAMPSWLRVGPVPVNPGDVGWVIGAAQNALKNRSSESKPNP